MLEKGFERDIIIWSEVYLKVFFNVSFDLLGRVVKEGRVEM